MEDVIVMQQVSITDYFNKEGLFNDLGTHLYRCQNPELEMMNKQGYEEQVRAGMKALTETATSHDVLKLAKVIKGHNTLWEGLKVGFSDGIHTRLESGKNDPDLVHLALGLRVYPDLQKILHAGLSDKNYSLETKSFELDGGGHSSVVFLKRADQESQIFVIARCGLSRVQDLSGQEDDLRRLAERTFPQQTPA